MKIIGIRLTAPTNTSLLEALALNVFTFGVLMYFYHMHMLSLLKLSAASVGVLITSLLLACGVDLFKHGLKAVIIVCSSSILGWLIVKSIFF